MYCYTWSRCTLMLNSTARIERMQRTAKHTLGMNGGTTLCQMNERIPVYNDDARRRIEIHDFKIAGRQLRAAAHLPAFIRPLQSRVSSYAFAHITSQAQEAANYCFEAPSTRSGTSYLVVRRAGTVVKAKGPTLDADGTVKSHECVHDEGLDPDPIAGRLVTAHFDGAGTSKTLVKASCTCQFGISSGMGLCRHVLCVATIEQTQSIKIENFCIPKWLHHDEAGKAAMLAKLMRTPRREPTSECNRAELPGGGQPSDPAPLDRRARRAILSPLMQGRSKLRWATSDVLSRKRQICVAIPLAPRSVRVKAADLDSYTRRDALRVRFQTARYDSAAPWSGRGCKSAWLQQYRQACK